MTTPTRTLSLTTNYDICAAHQLSRPDWDDAKNEAVFGHCRRLHGHQYKLELTITGPLNAENEMIINGYALDKIVAEKILSQMDHHSINDDIPYFKTRLTTAENIAVWIFDELTRELPETITLLEVKLYETPGLAAVVSAGNWNDIYAATRIPTGMTPEEEVQKSRTRDL